jgi:transcriptional regulator with XRE-family HTH domain
VRGRTLKEQVVAHDKRRSFTAFRDELLAERPGFRRVWEDSEPKRAIAAALVRLRIQAGRTQSEIAEQAGWDKGFVSRLEAAAGPVPDTATIVRYAAACDTVVGLVFATAGVAAEAARVLESVSLSGPGGAWTFEGLRDQELPAEPELMGAGRDR